MELSDRERGAFELFKQSRSRVGFITADQIGEWDIYTVHRRGHVVGAAAVEPGGSVYILHALATDSAARREGVASKLVSEIVADAAPASVEAKVDTDAPANDFYEAAGWRLTRTTGDGRMNVWVSSP